MIAVLCSMADRISRATSSGRNPRSKPPWSGPSSPRILGLKRCSAWSVRPPPTVPAGETPRRSSRSARASPSRCRTSGRGHQARCGYRPQIQVRAGCGAHRCREWRPTGHRLAPWSGSPCDGSHFGSPPVRFSCLRLTLRLEKIAVLPAATAPIRALAPALGAEIVLPGHGA